MRITKKFAGSNCIGKQVFIAGERMGAIDESNRNQILEELKLLEAKFRSKVDYISPRKQVALIGRFPAEEDHHQHKRHQSCHPAFLAGFDSKRLPLALPFLLPGSQASSSTTSESSVDSANDMNVSHSNHEKNFSERLGPITNRLRHVNQDPVLHPSFYGNVAGPPEVPSISHSQSSTAPIYKPRRAHTSADLFGHQYPTTIEQMTLISSEKKRNDLASFKGFHASNCTTMAMGDAAKFCSAAAHAYSYRMEDTKPNKLKSEHSISNFNANKSGSDGSERTKDSSKVDLEASDLLLNFFNSAGSSVSEKNERTCSSPPSSNSSGTTSTQGEKGDDNSISSSASLTNDDYATGRSSILSFDRYDSVSDLDLSNHERNSKGSFSALNNKRSMINDLSNLSVTKKQRTNRRA
jgi:hypothetical protein